MFVPMSILRTTLLFSLFVLTACESGEVRDSLGLTRRAPDEFVVVSRPALSVPPDFSLVAPEPGKQGPRQSTELQARSALLGRDVNDSGTSVLGPGWKGLSDDGSLPSDSLTSEFELQENGAMARRAASAGVAPVEASSMGSAAESRLLNQMGVSKADPSIRAKLGEDVHSPVKPEKEAGSLYESLTGADRAEPVVDPKGEAARLRDNKDKGKKPNEGEVVTEDTEKSTSVLDTLF